MVSSMSSRTNRNILLLVEGESAEVKLFEQILKCFPEIEIYPNNILVYKTNLWTLNTDLEKAFGDDWHTQEEIDFLDFLKSSNRVKKQIENLDNAKITDIFLVFDYERQEPKFNAKQLEKMLDFFNNSTENGQLYINYPMVESYKHLQKPLPDICYLDRKCKCNVLTSSGKNNQYKRVVGEESDFTDLRKITTEDFRQFVIHNLCKASYITSKTKKEISKEIAYDYWKHFDLIDILNVQNKCSDDLESGFVYILCTCLFFILEYNSRYIFNENNI